MALTVRQLEVLREMARAHAAEDWEHAEIAQEGLVCYVGLERISYRTLQALLDHVCVSLERGDEKFRRFTINQTGRLVARKPEMADKTVSAIYAGEQIMTGDDGIMTMDEWQQERAKDGSPSRRIPGQ